jgi:hypothetical protein
MNGSGQVNLKAIITRALVAAASLLLGATSGMAGTIIGSAHDFSVASWGGGQVCIACHTPHNALSAASGVPLWNHTASNAAYTMYKSYSLHATMDSTPTAGDKLCLSCHDGTIALGNFRGGSGANIISSVNNLGTDLKVHHPSSFTYNQALVDLVNATSFLPLFSPSSKNVTIGGTLGQQKSGFVKDVMLTPGGEVVCSSCHDVHNTYTATTTLPSHINGSTSNLLKISMNSSALCVACHDM